jgi:hypothetical protein
VVLTHRDAAPAAESKNPEPGLQEIDSVVPLPRRSAASHAGAA